MNAAIKVSVGVALCATVVSACVTTPKKPSNTQDLCALFGEKPSWYRAAKKSTEKWGGNIQLPMSIIYQESSFRSDAKPPMEYFLGIIPTGRPSDAYGYSQALKSTWAEYRKEVGGRHRSRDNFAAAFDFVQWYIHKTHKRNAISKWDYDAHYLNYHEGQGGYSRGTHLKKQWLLNTASRVDSRASRYGAQLIACESDLEKLERSW